VHHAFFVSFKYFHAVGTGKSHGKKASISAGQPVDEWLSLWGQRVCQNGGFHTFLEITGTYSNNEESKTRIKCKTIPSRSEKYFHFCPRKVKELRIETEKAEPSSAAFFEK